MPGVVPVSTEGIRMPERVDFGIDGLGQWRIVVRAKGGALLYESSPPLRAGRLKAVRNPERTPRHAGVRATRSGRQGRSLATPPLGPVPEGGTTPDL
jgi:hypothetical protein